MKPYNKSSFYEKKKRFDNDSGTVETTLIGLIFSITFSSLVIAFMLMQFYGYDVSQHGTEGVISLPDNGVLNVVQDYKTNTINDNINYDNLYGTWNYVPNVGRVLETGGVENAILALKAVAPTNNEYVVTYRINNSVKEDYGILVRYTGHGYLDEIVYVQSDGFHVRNIFLVNAVDSFFMPMSGANQVEDVTIKTVFNEEKGELKFYWNNALMFTQTGILKDFLNPANLFTTYYAGVSSATSGFTIESITVGAFNVSDISSGAGILEQLASFFSVIMAIVLWNVNPQFLPWELNLLFIKTQLAGIVICIVIIIRG